MIAYSSYWYGYNDTIKYQERKHYCTVSNGCFNHIDKECGDECVIVKVTNNDKTYILIIRCCILIIYLFTLPNSSSDYTD